MRNLIKYTIGLPILIVLTLSVLFYTSFAYIIQYTLNLDIDAFDCCTIIPYIWKRNK